MTDSGPRRAPRCERCHCGVWERAAIVLLGAAPPASRPSSSPRLMASSTMVGRSGHSINEIVTHEHGHHLQAVAGVGLAGARLGDSDGAGATSRPPGDLLVRDDDHPQRCGLAGPGGMGSAAERRCVHAGRRDAQHRGIGDPMGGCGLDVETVVNCDTRSVQPEEVD